MSSTNPKPKPQNPQPPENGKPTVATNGSQPAQKTQSIDELIAIREELVDLRKELIDLKKESIKSRKRLWLDVASGVAASTIALFLASSVIASLSQVFKPDPLSQKLDHYNRKLEAANEKLRDALCEPGSQEEFCKRR